MPFKILVSAIKQNKYLNVSNVKLEHGKLVGYYISSEQDNTLIKLKHFPVLSDNVESLTYYIEFVIYEILKLIPKKQKETEKLKLYIKHLEMEKVYLENNDFSSKNIVERTPSNSIIKRVSFSGITSE